MLLGIASMISLPWIVSQSLQMLMLTRSLWVGFGVQKK